MAFSKAQQLAISFGEGPALVLAGPGSGKTTVITHRVLRLIRDRKIPGTNILVITFTRAAAAEMKARFCTLSGGDACGVTFGTFHSVFFRILRYAYRYTSANLVSEREQLSLLREILEKLQQGTEDPQEMASALLSEISTIKSNDLSLEHYYSKNCPEQTFRKIYRMYTDKLSSLNKMDFDDILILTRDLLKARPDILNGWRSKFRYILIDEFQDINAVQYAVVRMLAAPSDNLFIVGDDDQSIYRFRGARPEIMLGFERDYPLAKRILLDINYRSDAGIVRLSNALISHNEARFSKAITASRPGKEPLSFSVCDDAGEQNRLLTAQILALHRGGIPYRDMAILFRTNLGGRFITDSLMKCNIPFYMRDTLPNLYDHWIAQDILSYLEIAAGSTSRALWLRIINRPNRYVSRDAFTPFSDVSVEKLMPYYRDKDWMTDRLDRLGYDIRMMGRMRPYAAIHYLRKAVQYEDYLKSYADERKMNLSELMDVLEAVHESSKPHKTLDEWKAFIQTFTEELKNQAAARQEPENAVTLCTLHGAKGLEYTAVFIPDINEDTIPHNRAALDADIEEERRLFYVGITRAKDYLFLSCLKQRLNHRKDPSRFLGEMGLLSVNEPGKR